MPVRAQNAHRFSIREYTRALPPPYLSTCVYVYTYGSKGKIPFNRWSTTVQKRRLRRGKEGWTNSYTFRRRFVPSFEKPSHRCPFYFLSFSFFFRQRGHCPWLNGREKGQKRFIEIRRSEVERRQKPLFVKPLLAARRFLFAVFCPLVANLSPASRCTHTITLPPHSFTMRAYDRFSKSIVREWSFNEVSRARDSRLVQN